MSKKGKGLNISICGAINIIIAVSLVTVTCLSFIGYQKVNVLKNNVDSIYYTDIQKMELSRLIVTKISEIQNDINSQIINYDSELDSMIEENAKLINESIISYLKLSTDEDEKKNVDNLLKILDDYDKLWKTINSDIKNNKPVDFQAQTMLTIREKMAIDELNRLVRNNDSNAQKKCFSTQNTAKYAGKQLLAVGLSGFFILTILSVTIIISIKNSLRKMLDSLEVVASGNMNVELETQLKNEFGIMNKSLDKTVKSVSEIILQTKEKTDNIVKESKSLDNVAKEMVSASKDVYNATQIMSEGSASQAQDLMNINKHFDKFSEKLNGMLESVNDISESNRNIRKLTSYGEEGIITLTSSSEKVSASFTGFQDEFKKFTDLIEKVNSIVEVISGIAEQTKLLSLNASIEAARAGEHGKGFAVVANEVNKLSEESRESTEKITKLIEKISNVTNDIIIVTQEMDREFADQQNNTNNITDSFKNIIENIEKSTSKIENLSNSANEIINARDTLVDKVVNSSSIAEEISASSEEITTSASQMDSFANVISNTAETLNGIVDETALVLNKFQV